VALKDTTAVCGCGRIRTAAWWRPWNGTAGSRAPGSPDPETA